MFCFATQEDIDNSYGPDLLLKVADADRDGIPDVEIIDRALKSATGLINGYLKAQYTLPLAGTSSLLVELCVDIAVYKICLARATRTNEMRVRYEDAICTLKDIASGKAGIVIDGDDTSGGAGDGTGTGAGSQPTYAGRSIDTYRS